MYKGKKILAIIPARGGSKGLPGKNIKPLLGKPLIAWTIEQALQSKYIDCLYVSTDNEEIRNIALQSKADASFLRPPELSADNSPICDAVIYSLSVFENRGNNFDYVALLEPTSPLRRLDDIDNAIKSLVNNQKADSLVSVGEVHMEHPMIVKKILNGYVCPYIENIKFVYQRQQVDKAFFPYGVIYICKVPVYRQKKTFYLDNTLPYYIERWQNYEVDDTIDFLIIENILKNKKIYNG